MKPMILCPACQRHLFAGEASCPFCGLALAPQPPRSAAPNASADLSRAQRFAIGAAIAVSMASAGCGGAQQTDTTNPSGGSSNPSGGTTNKVAGPSDDDPISPHYGDRTRTPPWREHSNPCTPDGQCPPYGCVFPDDACDVVRA